MTAAGAGATRARAPRVAVALAVLVAALAAGCAREIVGSERLTVTAPAWTWTGRAVELRVQTKGALAERSVTFSVSVNGDTLGRFPTQDGTARIEIPARHLRGGQNRIALKTGTERVELELRAVPIGLPATLLAAIVIAAVLLALRRRKSGGASSVAA